MSCGYRLGNEVIEQLPTSRMQGDRWFADPDVINERLARLGIYDHETLYCEACGRSVIVAEEGHALVCDENLHAGYYALMEMKPDSTG